MRDIHTFIEKLPALGNVVAIHTITRDAGIHVGCVEAILTFKHPETKIAIFIVTRMIRVVRIYAVFGKERNPRDLELKLFKLLEKWTGEIKRLRILRRIPTVSPPAGRTIYLVGLVW